MSISPKKTLKTASKSNDNMPKIAPKHKIVPIDISKDILTMKEDNQNNKELAPIKMKDEYVKLWLDSVPHTRKSLSRIIRLVGRGDYPIDKAGKMCYLIQTLLMAFKTEADLSDHDTLVEIAKVLKKDGKL